ncbi:hypothetical protein B0T16DRAFT_408852 [Cercophora newfieldiana]|uniref:Diphthine methyltransferase n=1 Tax=Cercophora newfieldiana TaxID=92897 RepID=A0AA40CSA0_9PEZI|nr:hypothetical protein B0T16DRAFT_408852 [Cercophora newfieldiana]
MADQNEVLEPISSTRSLQLDLPPSCVEFCPASQNYFLVGTYNLQKDEELAAANVEQSGNETQGAGPAKPQTRNGSILAFRLAEKTITHIQTEPLPSAILDLHFNPIDGFRDYCGAVSSTATLTMFRFCPDEAQPLRHIRTMGMAAMARDTADAAEPDSPLDLLFLSFCWHPSKADTMAITTSTGNVHLVRLGSIESDHWTLDSDPIITHSLEAWCVAISPSLKVPRQDKEGEFTIFSGGDDSVLCYRNFVLPRDSVTTEADYTLCDTTVSIKRKHEAGVTAILPLPVREAGLELVLTGSYDDHIRLFSVGPAAYGPAATKLLAKQNLGGGVWRLKLVSVRDESGNDSRWKIVVLASCMHGGAGVVELVKAAEGDYHFRVVGSFVEHKSMNYGSDVQPGLGGEMQVISTSFYDKLLCLWEFGLV